MRPCVTKNVSYPIEDQRHGLTNGVEQHFDEADEPDGFGSDLEGVAGADGLLCFGGCIGVGTQVFLWGPYLEIGMVCCFTNAFIDYNTISVLPGARYHR